MTAITPLEFIHKKGIFGDHQRKEEKELLKISEIKGLFIFQVVQYKKSNKDIKQIKLDSLEFPLERSSVASNNQTRILWSGPKTWLIISSEEKIANKIKESCDHNDFALTDISHSRAVIQITGINSRDVLKKGCPLNINELKKNNCASSLFHGISITIDCINNEPDTFNLLTLRSFGESFYHHISDSALEFGYVGI